MKWMNGPGFGRFSELFGPLKKNVSIQGLVRVKSGPDNLTFSKEALNHLTFDGF